MRSRAEVIAALAPTYVWWQITGTDAERTRRILAQIMELGTYDHIRAVEAVFASHELIDVMAHAQPGWFSPRSWDFWRGRLSPGDAIPLQPPQRSFDGQTLQARV